MSSHDPTDLEDVIVAMKTIIRTQTKGLLDKCEAGVFDINDSNKLNYLVSQTIQLDKRDQSLAAKEADFGDLTDEEIEAKLRELAGQAEKPRKGRK